MVAVFYGDQLFIISVCLGRWTLASSLLSVCAPGARVSSGHGVTTNQSSMQKTEITSFTSRLSELIQTKVVTVQAELVIRNSFLYKADIIFWKEIILNFHKRSVSEKYIPSAPFSHDLLIPLNPSPRDNWSLSTQQPYWILSPSLPAHNPVYTALYPLSIPPANALVQGPTSH